MPSPFFPASPASSTASRSEKEKGVNVQVLLRCRPFNEEELRINAPQVILCNEARREVTVNTKLVDRTFLFDKVFGQQAQQKDLYDQAIVPIVNDVLEGFNCTIFAYGQTGTGKTYTMEGLCRKSKTARELHDEAGVIPRAVQQIFDTLERQHGEYIMKVTFLEFYNEEITDLLAHDDVSKVIDDKQRKPLVLMEDGKGGVMVRGLEEEVVYNANQIFTLLERGSAKRRTAETLLNKQSSRSHSIFSINLHIKEASLGGEEVIKCGRLNLVDLAGSENISRSGARESRAREAGEINKSLLTLGRVITALVEHMAHVPYRDSKLTRLLRDSLGGKTKTCIIATVSPSLLCLEETLNTLDYAYRAKSIKNKPEMNQKVLKSAVLKDLYMEIEKLKAEVLAARERNGVYLPRDRYLLEEAEKKAMSDKLEAMETEIQLKGKQFDEMQATLESQQQLCDYLTAELEGAQKRLEQTKDALSDAREKIKKADCMIQEREYIIARLQQSENRLVEKAFILQSDLEGSLTDITNLHLKIGRKDNIEAQNLKLVRDFHCSVTEHLEALHKIVASSVMQQQEQLVNMEQRLKTFVACKENVSEDLKKRVLNLKDSYCYGLKGLDDMIHEYVKGSSSKFESINSTVSAHSSALEKLLSIAASEAAVVLKDLQTVLNNHENDITSFVQQLQKGALQNIEASRAISNVTVDFFASMEKSMNELCQSLYATHQMQQESLTELEDTYQECSKMEEQHIIEKITEMLAAAAQRKSNLVHSKLKHLRDNGTRDFKEMEQGMLDMRAASSKARIKWQGYMSQVEAGYADHSFGLSAKNTELQRVTRECIKGTLIVGEKWREFQESLRDLERSKLLQVESIVGEAFDNNELLLSKFEESSLSVGCDIQQKHDNISECIEGCLKNDRDAGNALLVGCSSQSSALMEFRASHNLGISDIEHLVERCLHEEYMEDKPTCTAPRQRTIELSSKASIEALRSPCVDKIIFEFESANAEKSCVQNGPRLRDTSDPVSLEASLLKDVPASLITISN